MAIASSSGHPNMSAISAILRPAVVALLMMLGLLAYGRSADQRKQKDYGLPRRQQVIGFLTESVEWYRSSPFEREIPIQPADIPLRENAQAVRLQILRLSLDYAKALAADQARGSVPRDQSSDASAPDASGSDLQHWITIETQCEAEARDARNDVASIRNEVETHRGKNRPKLEVALSESESRVDLVQAKCQTYGNLLDFVRTMNASNPQNQDLVSIIDDLSRTVPELATTVSATPPSQPGFSPVVPPWTGSSIPNLIFDVLWSRRKLRMLDQAGRTTDRLAEASQDLRNPLAQYLYSALQSANLSGNDVQRSDLDDLRKQQVRLDHLSAQITALAPAIVALDKQKILFGIYKSDLVSWRTLVVSQYTAAWKRLIIHLVAIVGVVILLVILDCGPAPGHSSLRPRREPTSHHPDCRAHSAVGVHILRRSSYLCFELGILGNIPGTYYRRPRRRAAKCDTRSAGVHRPSRQARASFGRPGTGIRGHRQSR